MTSERKKKIRQRRKARNKNKLVAWFRGLSKKKKALLIAGAVILCLLIATIIYVASIFSKLNTEEIKEEDIVVNEEVVESVGVGYTNFVLFGGDSRKGDVTKNLNTDSIIIVSLNNETKEVKMISVYRDTLLDMTNGKIQKCNSAYSRGGATQAINMLNMNLDLDIKKYVTVDFGSVSELVDMLGGIEIDVSEKEWREVNKYIDETAQVAGKKAKHLTHGGLQTLDGVQATTYSRIRKNVGDDYARTGRQRLVIQKVVEKAMRSDLATINKIVNKLFPRIATNFTMTELLSYAKDFTKYSIGETTGFPFVKGSGTIPGRGSCVFPMTLKSNVTQLHEFLYGTEGYQPSSKVVKISGEIASVIGNRKADPVVTPGQTGGDGITPGEGDTTTQPGDGTTKPDEGATTTKPGEGDDTTKPGEGDGTNKPGEGDETTKPGEGDDTTKPGEGDDTTEPGEGDDTTKPGEGGTTTPGEGETTTPDEGGTTTPSGGGTTSSPSEGEQTPTP